jgi:hypothetical protein
VPTTQFKKRLVSARRAQDCPSVIASHWRRATRELPGFQGAVARGVLPRAAASAHSVVCKTVTLLSYDLRLNPLQEDGKLDLQGIGEQYLAAYIQKQGQSFVETVVLVTKFISSRRRMGQ